jgi:hypothetical protein
MTKENKKKELMKKFNIPDLSKLVPDLSKIVGKPEIPEMLTKPIPMPEPKATYKGQVEQMRLLERIEYLIRLNTKRIEQNERKENFLFTITAVLSLYTITDILIKYFIPDFINWSLRDKGVIFLFVCLLCYVILVILSRKRK